jgi:phosphodiesterase/alkaline phosphatase D-like protein
MRTASHLGWPAGTAAMLMLTIPSVVAAAEPAGFSYGVAAGEVAPTSAMLWTRAAKPGTVVLKVSRAVAKAGCSAGPAGARSGGGPGS